MMINLKQYKNVKELIALLSECIYPDEERVLQVYEQYRNDKSTVLLGKIENNELVGLIGISYLTEDEVELRHMAVKSNKRRLGLGKKLIRDFINENLIKKMEAETDKDAVDFYRKIGFQIMSLGEKYPGVERFKCILTKD